MLEERLSYTYGRHGVSSPAPYQQPQLVVMRIQRCHRPKIIMVGAILLLLKITTLLHKQTIKTIIPSRIHSTNKGHFLDSPNHSQIRKHSINKHLLPKHHTNITVTTIPIPHHKTIPPYLLPNSLQSPHQHQLRDNSLSISSTQGHRHSINSPCKLHSLPKKILTGSILKLVRSLGINIHIHLIHNNKCLGSKDLMHLPVVDNIHILLLTV